MKERIFAITFPGDLVREPVLYSLVQRYDLLPNVFRASVTGESGWLIVTLTGDDARIDAAVLDLKCRGAYGREGGKELLEMDAPATITSVRVRLKIPKAKVREPILSSIIKNNDVVINIRQASIGPERGVVDLEISGELEAIDRAVESLKKDGIGIDPIEGNVIE